MHRLITYFLVFGIVLYSGCSLFYKETISYDVFDPECKPIKTCEPRWRIFSTEAKDARRVAQTHDKLKAKWGRQLEGEWQFAETETDLSNPLNGCMLSFGNDNTAHMTVKNGDALLKRDGSYLFKEENTAGSVLIMVEWNLPEEERKQLDVVDWLPLVLNKGTNIFLQCGDSPQFIKSNK